MLENEHGVRKGHESITSFAFDPQSPSKLVGAGLTNLFGLVFVVLQVLLLDQVYNYSELFMGTLIPIFGAYILVIGSYIQWKSDLDRARTFRVTVWTCVGLIVGTTVILFAVWYFSLQLAPTMEFWSFVNWPKVVLTFATIGSLTGWVIGWYDAHRSQQYDNVRKQRRRLKQQNERLDEFASVISHDLRNPLNVAKGRLDLARESSQEKHFDAMKTALDRMDVLISDTLELARQGKTIDDPTPVDLEAVITDSWNAVETGDVDLTIEDSLAKVTADDQRLGEAVENLFRNAIDHGENVTTIWVGRLSDGGLYFEDDGVGIPEENREMVFEAGVTTSSEGTGLGLAIVRSVIEAHGWEISATEGREGGARFEIDIQ